MAYVLVRHKVADYARWKPVFDEHAPTRRANGSRGGQLFRNAGDPNEVVIVLEWDDLEKARRFAQSDDLRETMQRAGVADRPDVYFLEEVEAVSV
jgi:heme-degrading monooxygenase HmoA